MRCVAVDWSGRASDAAEFMWIAEARDGELVFLENGRDRGEVVRWLVGEPTCELVVGLDFAFSFPAWYCRRRGWRSGPEVWRGVAGEAGKRLLADERPPFWGRTTTRPAPDASRPPLRATEAELATKSPFQIGGAGAVGTGSIRGMPHLVELAAAGFSIWPFTGAGTPPVVVEIYPRALYPPAAGLPRLSKRRWASRRAHLEHWFPDHPRPLLERAAGSEDAFDAAVSALVMSAHAESLGALPGRPGAPQWALEGCVWTPELRPGS